MSRGICLVIEDDADIADLVSFILSQAGFEVHVARSGMEGLDAAAALDPALITLDLGLPDIDGLHVAQGLRGITAVPILMLTARARITDEMDGLSAGASGYLVKPFRPRELRILADRLCPAKSPTGPSHSPAKDKQ
ncbi:response regulator transcription factor [Arthrobacter sp. NPDC093128]|uniref:response regulator transcription factor n=1 Tax=Arthrobacter sp. NPDC093128 TaxID=3154979 RepID=UPI00342E40B9